MSALRSLQGEAKVLVAFAQFTNSHKARPNMPLRAAELHVERQQAGKSNDRQSSPAFQRAGLNNSHDYRVGGFRVLCNPRGYP